MATSPSTAGPPLLTSLHRGTKRPSRPDDLHCSIAAKKGKTHHALEALDGNMSAASLPENCSVSDLQSALRTVEGTLAEVRALREVCEKRHNQEKQDLLFRATWLASQAQKRFEQQRIRMARVHESREHALKEQMKKAMTEQQAKAVADYKLILDKYSEVRMELNALEPKYHRALSDSTFYQSGLEAATAELHTARDDFKELQRIVHEDKIAAELREAIGLPPAYDTLDEDPMAKAPYGQHEDAGDAHIAKLQCLVRETFDNMHSTAQYEANERRYSRDANRQAEAGTELFLASSRALYKTCDAMLAYILKANDVKCSSHSKQKNRVDEIELSSTPVSNESAVADRVANLIIECSHKLIASIEMRYFSVVLNTDRARTFGGLHWRIVDDITRQAVTRAITAQRNQMGSTEADESFASSSIICSLCKTPRCTGHCTRMFEMYQYQIKLSDIRRRLATIVGRHLSHDFFSDTLEWLSENIEIERQLSANAYLPRTRSPSPADPPPPSPTLVDEPIASGSGSGYAGEEG